LVNNFGNYLPSNSLRVYNFAVSASKSVNNLRFYLAVNGLHVYKLLPSEIGVALSFFRVL
jgi:hypothetical protein